MKQKNTFLFLLSMMMVGCMPFGSNGYITVPMNGQSISGTQTIAVAPPADADVERVAFYWDETLLGYETTMASSGLFTRDVNTEIYTNGFHSIDIEIELLTSLQELTDRIEVYVNN